MQGGVIKLGLAGFGTVGSGLARIIEENRAWIRRRLDRDMVIKTVLVRDCKKSRPFQLGPETTFTTSMDDILSDPEIDVVVELIGGIETARTLISGAIEAGKHVVTANKALLAEHGSELFAKAAAKGVGLYFEASVAGGIPIVQTLKESLAGNRIKSISGILNGTANYILTEMTKRGLDFDEALRKAQEKGYAEADPTLDIEGLDAAHKLVLLIRLAYGQEYPLSKLPVTGIINVSPLDIQMAARFGYRIKLLGQVRERSGLLDASVQPTLIKEGHILAEVEGPYNAILVEGNAVGQVMLYGKGAGDLPTGSAVLSDIMSLCREGCKPNNTGFGDKPLAEAKILQADLANSRYYFRFSVIDRPGVLSEVAGVMGQRNISLAQVVQMGNVLGKSVPIVFLTHEAQESNVKAALREIDAFSFVTAPTVSFRINS